MITATNTFVRDGNKYLEIIREVDTSKPKCWVDGHEYKFNSTLISMNEVSKDVYDRNVGPGSICGVELPTA